MKKLLLLLLLCSPAWASITQDTHCANDNGNTSASTVSCTMTVTAGDLIICAATWGNVGVHTATCADSVDSGNYPVACSSVNDSNLNQIIEIWYFANAKGGSTTVKVTTSGAETFFAMAAVSEKGAKTDSTVLGPCDGTANGTGSGTYTSNNITPANNGSLIFSTLTYANAITGAGTGYTLIDDNTNTGYADESQVQATAASTNATWNAGTNSQFWHIFIVAFYPATGGTTCAPTLSLMGVSPC